MSFKYNDDIWTILLVSIEINHSKNEDLLTGKLEERSKLDNNGSVFIRLMLNYSDDMNRQITLIYPYNNFVRYYDRSRETDLADRLKQAAYNLIKSNEIEPYIHEGHHKDIAFPIYDIENIEDI